MPEAFFLDLDDRGKQHSRRFCLFHSPQNDDVRGNVLYIHPFAEEMNKSRRMAALQSRALSLAGYAVLQIDLLGCGDSPGDFADATWQDWVQDVVQACLWLTRRSDARLCLWGLRAGCLVAAQAANQLEQSPDFVFWAPTASGKIVLQQFLRLRIAGDLLAGNTKGTTEFLRQQLMDGLSVEVAGYDLPPPLASGLELATLAPPEPANGGKAPARLEWFEMSTREDASLSPVSARTSAQWSAAGFLVRSHLVKGPSFWQTSEVEEAPSLVAATLAALASSQANET